MNVKIISTAVNAQDWYGKHIDQVFEVEPLPGKYAKSHVRVVSGEFINSLIERVDCEEFRQTMNADTTINDAGLGLSRRTRRILSEWYQSETTSNDVPTMGDLYQRGLSCVELHRIKGAGKVALFQVENAFKRANLSLLPF